MNTEEKNIIVDALSLIKKISNSASENSRKAYLGQFINSFSFDKEIDELINKLNKIPTDN